MCLDTIGAGGSISCGELSVWLGAVFRKPAGSHVLLLLPPLLSTARAGG